MEKLISKFASVNVALEINMERFVAKGINMKAKSIFAKPVFHYKFSSQEQMENWLNKFVENRLAIKAHEEARKARKKEALQVNPYKVGQIVYDSWGYEQTNIDFYLVVGSKGRQVILQEIGGRQVECDHYGSMAGRIAPNPSVIIGSPIKKMVNAMVDYGNNVSYYLKSKHGIIKEYVNGEEGVYNSWGY